MIFAKLFSINLYHLYAIFIFPLKVENGYYQYKYVGNFCSMPGINNHHPYVFMITKYFFFSFLLFAKRDPFINCTGYVLTSIWINTVDYESLKNTGKGLKQDSECSLWSLCIEFISRENEKSDLNAVFRKKNASSSNHKGR